jgi:CHAT domain-containing protein/tetratricopeptide (TPR) repeat protein
MGFWNRFTRKKTDSKPEPRLSPDDQLGILVRAELSRLPRDTQKLIYFLGQTLVDPGLESKRLQVFELVLEQVDQRHSPNLWVMLLYDFASSLLSSQTSDRAENLENAIAVFQASLKAFTSDKSPLWARIQNNLGEAWRQRIEGNRAENLELSINAYTASLEVFTRDDYPEQWATLQGNLGAAYAGRIKENKAENIEKSILAFQNALEVRTRDDFPAAWAQIQVQIGRSYTQRVYGDRAQNINQAVIAFKSALEIFSQDDYPVLRAEAQNALDKVLSTQERDWVPENELEFEFTQASQEIQQFIRQLWELDDKSSYIHVTRRLEVLGQTLRLIDQSRLPHIWAELMQDLGETLQSPLLGDRAKNLERAITTLADVEVKTRDKLPINWTRAKVSLGNALVDRIRGDRAENLEQAIDAYTAAQRVYTQEQFPKEWSIVQNNIGGAYYKRIKGDRAENIEKAFDCYQAVLKLVTKENSPGTWAMSQSNLGALYLQRIRGDRSVNQEQGIRCCNAALEIYNKIEFPFEWALVNQNLIGLYNERVQGNRAENLEQALTACTDALQVYTHADFPLQWAAVQINMGAVYSKRIKGNRAQNLEQAVDALTAALEIYTKDEFPEEWAKIQINMGDVYENRIRGDRAENLERAIGASTAAQQVYTQTDFPLNWVLIQNNLGNAFRERIRGDVSENLERSIDAFQAVLEVNTRNDFPIEWALAQNNLGNVYTRRIRGDRAENLERAIDAYNSALEVRKQADFPRQWALTQINLGTAYKERIQGDQAENLEMAIDAFQAALKVYSKTEFPVEWAGLQNNLGNAYINRIQGLHGNNIEQAIDAFNAALEINTRNDFPVQWVMTHINLGDAYKNRISGNRTENLNMAVAAFTGALSGAQELGIKEYERGAAEHLGFLYYNERDWSKAYKAVDTAIAALEAMRAIYFSEEAKVQLAEQNALLYTCMVDTCLRLGHVQEALERAEAGKSRLFLDQLGFESFPPPALPPALQSSFIEESDSIAELRYLKNAILNTTDDAQHQEFVAQHEEKQTALKALWSQMELHVPEYVALRRGDPIKYNHLQAMVDRFGTKAAFVEFYTLPGKVVAFILRSGGQEPIAIPIQVSKDQLQHHVANYIREIWEYGRRGDIGQNWQELAEPLLEEVLPFLEGLEMVYIVPHGLLHYLPIHALYVNGQYLIDRFPITYVPSAGVLDRVMQRTVTQKQPGNKRDALVLGYTPNEREREVFEGEAIQVADFFGTKAHLGKNATGALFREVGAQYNILHLSCHGFFNFTDPMDSGIQLADGVLTARDIMSLKLNASLVTLSSCESGRSEIGSGDEVVGLTRALLYAGASSVLVSLWSVNAVATLEIMRDFYGRLWSERGKKIKTEADALQEAMLEMRKNRDHPYYWAPFILVGDSR